MNHLTLYEKYFLIQEKKKDKKYKDVKWLSKAIDNPGSLKKKLGVPEGETIPMEKINSKIDELETKAEGDDKLSKKDRKLLRRLVLAKTLKTNFN
ncbi:MAG: hypothetical protein JXA99_12015 [Candidatus Lokiarchaeota archaeon]|jgi:hypothetical protein|nr:hypothetical protein [Candidatus Lokiarchaeota archaeon]